MQIRIDGRHGQMERMLAEAPEGSKAISVCGGHWLKMERGWRWCTGSVFPRPGADWIGTIVLPKHFPE